MQDEPLQSKVLHHHYCRIFLPAPAVPPFASSDHAHEKKKKNNTTKRKDAGCQWSFRRHGHRTRSGLL
jgi:hypothetical protein